ncbi:MAG: hypothetical protein KDE53_17930, partial [Caldilineaceae bacterium]|nr:hypothetical protein [Caldilineaceae bacterium]
FTADGTAGIELAQIYENKSEERPWLDGVVARFVPGVLQQMALTRSTGPGGNSLWVLFYDPNVESNFGDSYAEFLLPPPRHIFAGDVDDNGDDELFLLRDVPTSAGSRPHLIMRNYNNETEGLPTFELILDADNGYNAGTTGDVDGDGRAEVVIMRNNNLRVYTAPESGASTALNFVPPVATDQRVVQAGNLDRNGYLKIPELGVSPPQLTSLVVYSGETRTAQLRLTALATGAEGPIPFELSLPAAPSWLTVTPQRGETTANVTVQVDASTLAAGTYESTIVITSLDPTVANSPFRVDVAVTVLPGLVVETKSLLVPLTCGSEGETTRRTLTLNGPTGLIFSATVGSGNATALLNGAVADPQSEAAQQAPTAPHVVWPSTVPWVTAASSNILPTTMELTFHGNAVAAGTTAGNTTLELVFFDKFGRQLRTVALGFFCADHQQYLPLIRQ